MNTNRRSFLKSSAVASAVGVAISAGLISPRTVLASSWPQAAFEASSLDAAISAAFGGVTIADSNDIKLKAPDIAENGAVVPIQVTSNIAGTESISFLVSNNNTPMTATFNLSKECEGFAGTRIKMLKTSDVIAVVKAKGKYYKTTKEVKVTIGGCGG
jgi:sulfur-oxidizing protein SoxY